VSPAARQRRVFGAAIVISVGAVCLALISQHGFGYQPCPWCILQRMIFLAIAIASLPGMLPLRVARQTAAGLVAALSACGIAAALWQHFVAARSASCNLTLADRIIRGLGANELWAYGFQPEASCADAAVRLFGLPYEFYSLTLFIIICAGAIWVLIRRH
jgi:protein dithiol:quinone oxidoreductase